MKIKQFLPAQWRLTRLGLPLVTVLCSVTAAPGGGGAETPLAIFNGTNFVGWRAPDPNPFWKISAGVLVGENDEKLTGNVLFTERSYTNFVLELEARWSGEIDSGVMLRHPELQLQFGISRSLKKDMTGAFYTGGSEKYPEAGQARGVDKLLKDGDWNRFRLEAVGDSFSVWLNGDNVVNYTNATFAGGGPIGLQIHPSLKMKVEFRNIRAKALQ